MGGRGNGGDWEGSHKLGGGTPKTSAGEAGPGGAPWSDGGRLDIEIGCNGGRLGDLEPVPPLSTGGPEAGRLEHWSLADFLMAGGWRFGSYP